MELKNNTPGDSYLIAKRAALYILFLNLILFVTKLIFGWTGHSFALLADGFNNLTDTATSLIMYFALKLAAKPADKEHAYGHGRIETEIARLLGFFVLATAGAIIIGAFQNIKNVDEQPEIAVIIVAFISMLVKEYMYRYQRKKAKEISSRALEADSINHRTDVGATACVLIGTLVVKIGGTKLSAVDDLSAIAVGIIMAFAAVRVIISSTQDLLDTMPPEDIIKKIRTVVESISGIYTAEKVLGRRMGMYYNIDVHIEVEPELAVKEAHYLSHQAKDKIKDQIPEIGDVLVHVEPYLPKN